MGIRGLGRAGDPIVRAIPWLTASVWASPDRHRKDSSVLVRLANARSLGGITIVIAVNIYTGSRDITHLVDDEIWAKSAYNTILAACLLPIAMILVFAATKREHRKDLTCWPVVRAIALMISTAVLPLIGIVYLVNWLSSVGPPELEYTGSRAQLTAVGILMVLGLLATYLAARKIGLSTVPALIVTACAVPVMPFLFCLLIAAVVVVPTLLIFFYLFSVALWASRTCCWVGRFHPLLVPPLSVIVITTFTVVSLVNMDTTGVPISIWLWLIVGGLTSTLALATAEWLLLRKQGYRYRYGPTRIGSADVRS